MDPHSIDYWHCHVIIMDMQRPLHLRIDYCMDTTCAEEIHVFQRKWRIDNVFYSKHEND